MSIIREAGAGAAGSIARLARPSAANALRAIAGAGALAGVWVAAYLAGQQTGAPWLHLTALVMVSVGAGAVGAAWARQRMAGQLHECRNQGQMLGQMLDVWCWQTDAQHRLIRLQPPPGASAARWGDGGDGGDGVGGVGAVGAGERLWQRFCDTEPTLPARLAARVALGDLLLLPAPPDGAQGDLPAPSWRLRGQPHWDGQGRFAGFLGVAWPTEPGDSDSSSGPALPGAARASERNPAHLAARQAVAAEHAAFSYTVSHDLRAPIRVIEGFGRILKEDYGAALDRVGRDHLDRVMAAAARMNHMIDALLSLSRLSTQPLGRQPVNLSQLARWVIDDLQQATPERAVAVFIAPDLVVQGDPTLLRMALENLLGNAWKYSAKVAQAQIRFEQVQANGRAAYQVQDNGAGFDMRFADRLFGVFQRLHSGSDFPGHGVGLASVQRIVRRHGGDVWAQGEVGQGARFCFTLRP